MTNLEIFYKVLDFLPNETYFRTTKVSSMENEYHGESSSLTLQSNNFLFSLQYHIRTLRWCPFIDFERGHFLLNSKSSSLHKNYVVSIPL